MSHVVIVTGAASGIGEAVSELLAEHGYLVAALDLKEAHAHPNVVPIVCDVRSDEQCAAVDQASTHGDIVGLVNNAGVERHGSVVTLSPDDWDLIIDVNLTAHARLSRYAIPFISEAGAGSIVNMASAQGLATQKNVAAYAAAKGGVIALTRAMALDHADVGIRVNAVAPGTIATELVKANAEDLSPADPESQVQRWGNMHALKRVGQPGEVAEVIEFLLSERASFITGSTYLVDGGLLASFGGPDL